MVPGRMERLVTWQLALLEVGFARVQGAIIRVWVGKIPSTLTTPVGGVGLLSVSVTVTVQVKSWLTTTGVVQVTLVVVV